MLGQESGSGIGRASGAWIGWMYYSQQAWRKGESEAFDIDFMGTLNKLSSRDDGYLCNNVFGILPSNTKVIAVKSLFLKSRRHVDRLPPFVLLMLLGFTLSLW